MQILLVAVAALAVLVVVSVISRRTGIASPLLLLGLGIAASYLPAVPELVVPPEILLAGVLPPLLYSSAVRLPVLDLRRNLGLISWLSVLLVVISALVVGLVVHLLFPEVPLGLAVALGAVVSPTDAVAATSIGKRLGLPHRLMSILEGESLVNDATAVVLLRSALAAVAGAFSFGEAVAGFALAVVVALAVGGVVGLVTVRVRARISDPVLGTAISYVVPFLASVPAEQLHGSGLLAAVVAGIITGHAGARRFSAVARSTESANWATVSFLLESGLFLLMGLELPGLLRDARTEAGLPRVLLIAAVTVGLLVVLRTVGVALPVWLTARSDRGDRVRRRISAVESWLSDQEPGTDRERRRVAGARRSVLRRQADLDFAENEPVGRRGVLVLSWAGMRGVVTLAAAQTIGEDVPLRSVVVLVAFVVAVVTLVGFGSTLPLLIRRLDFEEISLQDRREEVGALLRTIAEQAAEELGPLEELEVDGRRLEPVAIDKLKQLLTPLLRARGVTAGPEPSQERRDLVSAVLRRYLDALREALLDERSIGAYRTVTYGKVQALLDDLERRVERQG